MEVIRLSGYTELEKMEIARRFLWRKQMEATGLDTNRLSYRRRSNGLIQTIPAKPGFENLEREVGNVCRKVARQV